MWTPVVSCSALTLRRFGTYLLSQLGAVLELASIHDLFQAVQTGLATKQTEHDAAVDAVVRASGTRDRKHRTMRQALRTAAHMIRRAAGNRTTSPLYVKYFPSGMVGVLRGPIATEIAQVRDVLTKLSTEQDPMLQAQIPLLSNALQEAEDSLRQYDEAVADERSLRALLEAEKLTWIEGYRTTHSRLRIHFSATPEVAEHFFRSGPRGRRNTEEPVEPAQTQPDEIQTTSESPATLVQPANDTLAEAA